MPYLPVGDLDQAARRAIELDVTMICDRINLPPGSLMVITDRGGAAFVLWQDR
jgi:hypothetical protein